MSLYGFTSLMTVLMESGVFASGHSVGREQKMRELYKAMKVAVGPEQKFELKGSVAQTKDLVEWKGVPLLVSYCSDIL